MSSNRKQSLIMLRWVLLIFVFLPMVCCNCSNEKNETNRTQSYGIVIFKFEYCHLKKPLTICIWVMLASIAKVCFHHSAWLSTHVPESCLLILLGIPIGYTLKAIGDNEKYLTSELFFFYLLPPIILDAGYFMPSTIFYLNIGTILLYAVLGTLFNAFATGASLFAVASMCNVNLSILHALLFGSLIAAVDPVAVLAVFEEVHVHELLYMLVFGESVLNDAASVVLYRTFESLSKGKFNAEQIGLAFASFIVVSLGGTLIGVIFALLTSLMTRFTEHVRVIEPAFVFLMAYLSYLTAEMFHFSGIMSILFCGLIMKPYVESNVSRKSHTTIKYFLKLLSSSTEALIFMLFGVELVIYNHNFNMKFISFTLLFITIYRVLGVTSLTAFANRCGRLNKVNAVEQFIMSYGGLRGAVAFCLAGIIDDDIDKHKTKQLIVTTTMSVVVFTVFLQGTTIKPLVEFLGVKKASSFEKSMLETVNDKVIGYVVTGFEEVIGMHGHGYWRDLFEDFNRKYLRRWLERDPDLALDEQIFLTERRLAFKHALEYANNPSMIFERENDGLKLNEVKRNASYALELAMKAQSGSQDDIGILDLNIMAMHRYKGIPDSELLKPHMIAGLVPKRKRSLYSTQKYSLDEVDECCDHTDRYLKIKRNALAHMAATARHRKHRKSHTKHKKGRSKNQNTLPDISEENIDKSKESCSNDKSESENDDEDYDEDEGLVFKAINDNIEVSKISKPDEFKIPIPDDSFGSLNSPIVNYSNSPVLACKNLELNQNSSELVRNSQWKSYLQDCKLSVNNTLDEVTVLEESRFLMLPDRESKF
ncbi:Na(+)/H(+) exchanger beta isoform X2 [Hydra vulgaris]|uniref:Na(+)/H(+) exchanger beta isoform X2 n=1 Tax=Hydra vulgaris TaxID=6087 RepID=UPI0032E9F6FF